jgi:hypothetical protein
MLGIEDGGIVAMLLMILASLLACIGYGIWRWNEPEEGSAASSNGGEPLVRAPGESEAPE